MNRNTWTAAETDFLYENRDRMSLYDISLTLGKTDVQVYNKLYRLNFKEKKKEIVKKQFLDYMPAELVDMETADAKRKREYDEFFENYSGKVCKINASCCVYHECMDGTHCQKTVVLSQGHPGWGDGRCNK